MIKNILEQEKYQALRNMESFTQDMFNRIIDFQEKKHPAWNSALDFETRIQSLPLHYLIFSNADRDPTKFGPTIANYYPLHEEIIRISQYVKQLGDAAQLCDYYPGNGFIGSLIAREGVNTFGMRKHTGLPNQISEFFDNTVYRFSDQEFTTVNPHAVLASWPPSGTNPTPDIMAKQPQLIIYIYTEHSNPETGQRQTGSSDMFDDLSGQYQLIDNWSVTRPKNLLHDIWPDMTPNIEEHRLVRIYALQALMQSAQPISAIDIPQGVMPYDWEHDLHMAELALQAKQEIDMQRMMM